MNGYTTNTCHYRHHQTTLFVIHSIIIGLVLMLSSAVATGQESAASTNSDPWVNVDRQGTAHVQMYFFWSTQCPHCLEALPFVTDLAKRHSWLELQVLEISKDQEHVRLYRKLAETLGKRADSIPAFLFCGTLITGFESEATTGALIEELLQGCYQQIKKHGLRGWQAIAQQSHDDVLQLPLLGNIHLDSLSLPVITLLLAGLDSFNPCAFFVLLFLLSLLVHASSRTRMLLVGCLFVSVSGVVYFIFMAAWLNLFMVIGNQAWVTLLAGFAAVLIALFNIKDFFWLHRGISLSLPDRARSRLYQRVRSLLHSGRLPALLFGTVMLALAANSYELLCTAGFPMVFTRILTTNSLSPPVYYGYLLFYNMIYIIPLLTIVVFFSLTLGSHKLSERGGRLLKLLAGMMMLELGMLLILNPALLSSATVALILISTALLLTLLAARFLPDRVS